MIQDGDLVAVSSVHLSCRALLRDDFEDGEDRQLPRNYKGQTLDTSTFKASSITNSSLLGVSHVLNRGIARGLLAATLSSIIPKPITDHRLQATTMDTAIPSDNKG